MNIYEKINEVRKALLDRGITKDKSNSYYSYIDLPQIESVITEECIKVGLITLVDFPAGKASMTAIDTEHISEHTQTSVVRIEVPCESSMVEIKGSQPIQRVGGMLTYMRRYLYMQMFAISEHDAVEGIGNLSRETEAEQEKKSKKKTTKTTETPKTESISADPKKDEIIALFRKNLSDYIPTLEAYTKTKLEDMPTDYIERAYKIKMQMKEVTKEQDNADDI